MLTLQSTFFGIAILLSAAKSVPVSSREKIEDKTRFFDWLNFQSATDYVPMTPLQAPPLREVDLTTMKHDAIIADSSRDCETIQDEVTGRTLFTERALCPFHYVLNYNPKRIPSAIPEAVCKCTTPAHRLMGIHELECEPLLYQIRVLIYDAECDCHKEANDTISFACLPILMAMARAHGDPVQVMPMKSQVEQYRFLKK